MSLNPKFTFFLSIGIIFLFLIGFTHFQTEIAKEKDRVYQEQLRLQKENESITIVTPTPIPTSTPYIITTLMPMNIDNRLDLGTWYNWKENNASGLQQMNVSATFYKYKELENFTYYDYNWGYDFNYTAPENTEYLFAFFHIESDNEITGKDTRMYLPQLRNFALQINDMMYYPVNFDYEHSNIRQLEYDYNMYDTEKIKPYPYSFGYEESNTTEKNVKAPVLVNHQWLYGGKSNSEDGYIIFNIPKDTNKRMIYLNADFWSFGTASWRIYNG
jgi:hypothetical protein